MPFDGIVADWEAVLISRQRQQAPALDPATDPVIQQLRLGRVRIAEGWHRVPHGPKQRQTMRPWWWQRAHRSYCLVTAISMDATPQVAHDAADLLCRTLGVSTRQELYAWNDAPGRTKDEALLVYDRAIAQRWADLAKP